MSIKDAAKKNWQEKLNGGLESYECKKWLDEEGEPVTIYFNHPTVRTLIDIQKQAGNDPTTWQNILATVQARAKDKDGQLIWTKAEIRSLETDYDPEIIADIYLAMINHAVKAEEDVEDIKK